jgi:hypothetical protein
MCRILRCAAKLALLIVSASAGPALAAMADLPAAPTFSWGQFGAGLNISGITVQKYVNLDGTDGGSVINYSAPVSAPIPAAATPELIGNAKFEYVLWKGSNAGSAGATNRFGAALFGGLNLTASNAGSNFSFLQIYTDASTGASGVIDGGGYFGKFNSLIPRFGSTPGWDFEPPDYQYDFFDVPFDPSGTVSETVSFETALVSYDATSVQILGDYTWSFTTGANGNPQSFLTGSSVIEHAQASAVLLGLYEAAYPSIAYRQIVPEPSALLLAACLVCLPWSRRRRLAA